MLKPSFWLLAALAGLLLAGCYHGGGCWKRGLSWFTGAGAGFATCHGSRVSLEKDARFGASLLSGCFTAGAGRRCTMRRLWQLLELVALYALKRLIDWFFDKKN